MHIFVLDPRNTLIKANSVYPAASKFAIDMQLGFRLGLIIFPHDQDHSNSPGGFLANYFEKEERG
jgi:hypothetical protein